MRQAPVQALRVMISEGTICGAQRLTDGLCCGRPTNHSDDGPQSGHGDFIEPVEYKFNNVVDGLI